ncbi:hypothetical protein JTB14_004113 [Gonioctena quinquepunctata]|nr:hypothetical protein JTB14_004113 [Gonioctena quinquepunctata]
MLVNTELFECRLSNDKILNTRGRNILEFMSLNSLALLDGRTSKGRPAQFTHVHWDLLDDKYGPLRVINKNVFDSLLESDAPEEELGAEMESCDRYIKRFKLLKYKYEQLRGTTGSINEERASIVSRPASNVSGTADSQPTTKNRLKKCMCFLESRVENEERISLVAEGFDLCSKENRSKRAKQRTLDMNQDQESNIPSGSCLMNCEAAKCIFCEGTHDSHSCFKAQNYTLEQKKDTVTRKKPVTDVCESDILRENVDSGSGVSFVSDHM